jgi:hypothetical protein
MAQQAKPAKKLEEIKSTETAVRTRIEERQVQERTAIGAHIVHETMRREGEDELTIATGSPARKYGSCPIH